MKTAYFTFLFQVITVFVLGEFGKTTLITNEISSQRFEPKIFPNPTSSGEFNISVPQKNLINSIQVFTSTGILVEELLNINNDLTALKVKNQGVYFVRIKPNGTTYTKMLIYN